MEGDRDLKNRFERDWTVLNINVTWFCPVKCKYCHITSKASREDPVVLDEKKLIKECKKGMKLGVKEYRFSGGEPLFLGDKLFEYAEVVYKITDKKPAVLTSGFYMNEIWLKKARGRFSGIYISVENPLGPLQTVVDFNKMLDVIRNNTSKELPIKYGVTLVTAEHFKNLGKIFKMMYGNVNRAFMPQLEYPCLKDFIPPGKEELVKITKETKLLFKEYGIIPYYFVNIIGSLAFLKDNLSRVVVNLNPDGKYDISQSMLEAFKTRYNWIDYSETRQKGSKTCQNCNWVDCCKQHGVGLMYDWCELRKAIFTGIYEGLKNGA
jgi:MoaA/NifB/PqqE/SkfB family radical SAM enzyme